MIPAMVWVFLVYVPGPVRVVPSESFDTLKTCTRAAIVQMRKTNGRIQCVRMENTQ